GFPAAVGAKMAFPDKTVVCIDGDASFQMTACELTTATVEKSPILVLIINNLFLGMVRQWQELFYEKRFSSSNMTAQGGLSKAADQPDPLKAAVYIPDFVKLAEAHGARGIRVTAKNQVTGALEEARSEERRVGK